MFLLDQNWKQNFSLHHLIFKQVTLDSGTDVVPGITVASPLKNFHITILILFLHQFRSFFYFFLLQNFSKINERTPTFIPESRVVKKISSA